MTMKFLQVYGMLNPNIKKKSFLCLKTKQNTEMSDEKHSDSGFYYPEEQETTERRASRCSGHFDRVEIPV